MKIFNDTKGDGWQVEINTTVVKRVKTLLDINLLSLADDNFALLDRLSTDLILLVDVLYVVCCDQAKEREISDEEFGRRMAGDEIIAARDALIEELINFFPDARRRAMMKTVTGKARALTETILNKGQAAITEVESLDTEAVASALMSSFGSLPESLESTPAS